MVTQAGKVLLVQCSADMRLCPNYWNGISGFLDDARWFTPDEAVELELMPGFEAVLGRLSKQL